MRARAVLVALVVLLPGSAPAQILPWEVIVAEIESGRLRSFAQRLSKQNLLYQLHLGDVSKDDLVDTANAIDRVLASLEQGNPSYSVPAPWTPALREQVARVDRIWGPLRALAVASPYEHFRLRNQFMTRQSSLGDPLMIRLFDQRSLELVAATENLMDLYDTECRTTGLAEVCPVARSSGRNAMLIEQATKEAVYIVAGIDSEESRERLRAAVAAYEEQRAANDASPFFARALDPERGPSAEAAGALLRSLRHDWDRMRGEFEILEAGDEENFDVRRLLRTQSRLVDKVERMTAALIRYASATYGS
jgi:hypothetical protein